MLQYSQLIENLTDAVAEEKSEYYAIAERHAQVMWLEQKYFTPLKTLEGQAIRVKSPGLWNSEAGPDFKKAHLQIDNQDYIGDIEIHLFEEGWKLHRHHEDPAYNQVILHLSFWKSKSPQSTFTQSGKKVLSAYFEEFLTISEKRITQLIDLELYPYTKFTGSGKCAHALFKRLPQEKTEMFFRSAAEWRLTKKRRHLQARIPDARQYFAGGIALALGYKQNSEAFLELFLRLKSQHFLENEALLSLAMDTFGLFEGSYQKKWGGSPYYQHLRSYTSLAPSPLRLCLAKIRPFNHPVRRLAYLISLIKDPSIPQLYQRMEAHWKGSWPLVNNKKEMYRLIHELLDGIPNYENNYWNHHYTFESVPKQEFLPLIGPSLKIEILINAFLPLLQESILSKGIPQEISKFFFLFDSLPSQMTGKIKYLNQRFFGEHAKLKMLHQASISQGAYQLHHDFCLHFEASCAGCPFIDRFKTVYL